MLIRKIAKYIPIKQSIEITGQLYSSYLTTSEIKMSEPFQIKKIVKQKNKYISAHLIY